MNPKSIIKEIWRDNDGWWAILIPGWTVDNCSGVREDTKQKLYKRIREGAKSV